MLSKLDSTQLINSAKRTIKIEEKALSALAESISRDFASACQAILKCKGRVAIIGIGKSGHIARKIAATFSSTGTPAFFIHSAEAGHGDLGMLTKQDLVIMISYSGKSKELTMLIPPIKRLGLPLIAITGNTSSPLAKESEIILSVKVQDEACPLGLAPTSSTTVTLALGDALAVSLLEARGFTADDFAFSHPSGALGRKLLLKVSHIMHKGKDIPVVLDTVKINEVLLEITSKRLGITTVVNKDKKLVGVFTDGDLRRCLDKKLDIHKTAVNKVMTKNFRIIKQDDLAATALKVMDEYRINSLPVVDDKGELVGAMNLHDILKAGIV